MIIISAIFFLLQVQAQTFTTIKPEESMKFGQLYAYTFKQESITFLSPYSPSVFNFQLLNPQTQTLIQLLKEIAKQKRRLITTKSILGIEDILYTKMAQTQSLIIRQNTLEYILAKKNIYLNDLQKQASLYHMKLSNFSCLNTIDNTYLHSLKPLIQQNKYSSDGYLLLLPIDSLSIMNSIYGVIEDNDISITTILIGKIKNKEYIWDFLEKFQEKGCKMKWISAKVIGQQTFQTQQKDVSKEEILERNQNNGGGILMVNYS